MFIKIMAVLDEIDRLWKLYDTCKPEERHAIIIQLENLVVMSREGKDDN